MMLRRGLCVIRWLFILPIIAASIHVIEEFGFPGGFRNWYIRYRPEMERFLTLRSLRGCSLNQLGAEFSFL